MILRFLEQHLVMIPMAPRKPGCSVVEGKDIITDKVKALADAADACWNAIIAKDLVAFAAAYKASFNAQIAMFPGMVTPTINDPSEPLKTILDHSIQPIIDKWHATKDVLALKMPGAGGGGYLALVVKDAPAFCLQHEEAIALHIRRE